MEQKIDQATLEKFRRDKKVLLQKYRSKKNLAAKMNRNYANFIKWFNETKPLTYKFIDSFNEIFASDLANTEKYKPSTDPEELMIVAEEKQHYSRTDHRDDHILTLKKSLESLSANFNKLLENNTKLANTAEKLVNTNQRLVSTQEKLINTRGASPAKTTNPKKTK
ncbi:MAG TPA: hypothetical protein VK622_14400 [Puia sp.]|nr:hypothetical protein [Puia sp.]